MQEPLEDSEGPDMIPSVLAQQLRQGVEDFLRTTFPISTPFFDGLIDRLLAEEGSVFKGPYLSMQLPFGMGPAAQISFPRSLNLNPISTRNRPSKDCRAQAPLHHRGHRHRVRQDRMLSLSHPGPLLPPSRRTRHQGDPHLPHERSGHRPGWANRRDHLEEPHLKARSRRACSWGGERTNPSRVMGQTKLSPTRTPCA